MANLTNKQIKDTYNSLLKLEDNGDLSSTRKEITDGLGNGSNVKINNLGSLEASEFVKTSGLSTEFLKADGSVDSSTYLTSYTETDPLFTASPANGISAQDLLDYTEAHGWGDHSLESYATETYVTTQINDVLDSAPAALDTLNELAAAIGDDSDFAGTMTTALAGKASSSHTHDMADLNDFSIASEADEELLMYNDSTSKWENKAITNIDSYNNSDWDTAYANRLDYSSQGYITESSLNSATDSTITTPANGEALLYNSTTSKWENSVISTTDTNHYLDGATFNDADGVITMTVNGESDVTVDIDGRYSLDTHGHSLSSTSASGFMSSDQFDKLDGIAENATNVTDNNQIANSAGYITSYVDTNTQRSDQDIDDRIALNPEGFITSYVDTNTQRTDEDIRDVTAAQLVAGTGISIVENDPSDTITITNTVANSNTVTRVSGDNSNYLTGDVDIVGGTGITVTQATNDITITNDVVNTNTQRTDAEINTLIAANPEGFITSYVDTNTFRAIDDTPVNGATTTSISSNWAFDNVKTAVPTGALFTDTNTNTQRSDEEIRDTIGAIISGSGATTVTVDDAANTIVVSSTDTNTDTNTQRSDEDIRDVVASMISGGTGITVTENDPSNTLTITNDVSNSNTVTRITGDSSNYLTGDVKIIGSGATSVSQAVNEITITSTDTNTNTQLSDAQIAAMGYIKTDTNTQVTNNNQIANGRGFITSYTDTNTQLSDAQIAAMGYIKTDTNTQVTNNNQISNGAGYVTSSGNTVIGTDSDVDTSGATVIDNIYMTDGVITSHGTRTLTLANLGYTGATNANNISNNTQISNGRGYITSYTDTNTQLSDGQIAAMGYIKTYTDNNTTYSGGSYINLSGTTFNLDTSSSGDRWGKAMHIGSDGGMEAGYYMDFHTSDGDTSDYAARLTASSGKLTVSGGFHCTGTLTAAGDVIAYYSDERLKKDIEVIPNALEKVLKLKGVTYYSNELAEDLDINNPDKQVGFIAQDFLDVMPEVVRRSPLSDYAVEKGMNDLDDIKTLDYTKISPLLVEAIKEQQKQIDVLEDKLANKNIEFNELLKRIEKLENK